MRCSATRCRSFSIVMCGVLDGWECNPTRRSFLPSNWRSRATPLALPGSQRRAKALLCSKLNTCSKTMGSGGDDTRAAAARVAFRTAGGSTAAKEASACKLMCSLAATNGFAASPCWLRNAIASWAMRCASSG